MMGHSGMRPVRNSSKDKMISVSRQTSVSKQGSNSYAQAPKQQNMDVVDRVPYCALNNIELRDGVLLLSEATYEDLKMVREFVQNSSFEDIILAVWKMDSRNRWHYGNEDCLKGCVTPTACPYFCGLFCWAWHQHAKERAIAHGTVYAAGKEYIYQFVTVENDVGWQGCKLAPMRDVFYHHVDNVFSVEVVDNNPTCFATMFPKTSIKIEVPHDSDMARCYGVPNDGKNPISVQHQTKSPAVRMSGIGAVTMPSASGRTFGSRPPQRPSQSILGASKGSRSAKRTSVNRDSSKETARRESTRKAALDSNPGEVLPMKSRETAFALWYVEEPGQACKIVDMIIKEQAEERRRRRKQERDGVTPEPSKKKNRGVSWHTVLTQEQSAEELDQLQREPPNLSNRSVKIDLKSQLNQSQDQSPNQSQTQSALEQSNQSGGLLNQSNTSLNGSLDRDVRTRMTSSKGKNVIRIEEESPEETPPEIEKPQVDTGPVSHERSDSNSIGRVSRSTELAQVSEPSNPSRIKLLVSDPHLDPVGTPSPSASDVNTQSDANTQDDNKTEDGQASGDNDTPSSKQDGSRANAEMKAVLVKGEIPENRNSSAILGSKPIGKASSGRARNLNRTVLEDLANPSDPADPIHIQRQIDAALERQQELGKEPETTPEKLE